MTEEEAALINKKLNIVDRLGRLYLPYVQMCALAPSSLLPPKRLHESPVSQIEVGSRYPRASEKKHESSRCAHV